MSNSFFKINSLFQDAPRYGKVIGFDLKLLIFNSGFRYMFTFRGCRTFSKLHPLGIFFRLWNKRMQVKFGYQIPFTTEIGSGFFLGHFGNIVINKNCTIGKNCNISQGVTIGQVNRGEKKGCPEIGDRVWIGANAVIVGKIKIGNDVLIAPLTYVNFDIPEKAVVVGNPAQIISFKGSHGYINNLYEHDEV